MLLKVELYVTLVFKPFRMTNIITGTKLSLLLNSNIFTLFHNISLFLIFI